jgi:hypothetical protein
MIALKFIITIICISIFSLTTKGQSCTNCSNATITGLNASGLGTNIISTGNSTIAGGHTTTASVDYSVAFGSMSKATGISSFAFGAMVEANNSNYLAIGRHLKTTASATFILGTGIGPNQYLVNSTPSSLMVGFNSVYPTFFVGTSDFGDKTGKVAIGNMTNPTAKFHIYSDENEAAEIKFEPHATGIKQYAQIYFGTHTPAAYNKPSNWEFMGCNIEGRYIIPDNSDFHFIQHFNELNYAYRNVVLIGEIGNPTSISEL